MIPTPNAQLTPASSPGLIGQNMAPVPPTGPPAQQSAAFRQVSPSQNTMKTDEAIYKAKGLELLNSDQTQGEFMTVLKTGDPVTALVNALLLVLQKLDAAQRASGTDVADAVKLLGAEEFFNDLVSKAKAARIFTLDQAHLEMAFSIAVQDYIKGEVAAGRIDPAKLMQQMQQSMAKLPPAQRQEITTAMQRIQKTAQNYKGGQ